MAKTDPAAWSAGYVRRHERQCTEILEMFSAAMQNALKAGEYMAAAQCCNKMCDGLSLLADNVSADQYAPMLYTYSFILAQIAMFGIGGDRGLQAAIPTLQDAYDFARSCAKPGRRTAQKAAEDAQMIGNLIEDLKNGLSVAAVKEKYCPDFPENLIA